jgi:predicted dehydrogenase
MQVYCANGILQAPDPNTYGGPIRVRSKDGEWDDVPLSHEPDASHGFSALGAIESAIAIRGGKPPRASGQLAYHALDVLLSILESATTSRHVSLSTTCARPELLPLDADLAAAR